MKNVIYLCTGLECPAKLICQPKYALWGEIVSKSSFLISLHIHFHEMFYEGFMPWSDFEVELPDWINGFHINLDFHPRRRILVDKKCPLEFAHFEKKCPREVIVHKKLKNLVKIHSAFTQMLVLSFLSNKWFFFGSLQIIFNLLKMI